MAAGFKLNLTRRRDSIQLSNKNIIIPRSNVKILVEYYWRRKINGHFIITLKNIRHRRRGLHVRTALTMCAK